MNAKKKTMKTKKKIMIAALGVLAPVVLVSGIYYAYLMTPPPMPTTFEQALRTMDSARYRRLPDYRKAEYAAQARRLFAELPPERQELMRKQMAEIGREMGRGAKLENYQRFRRASRAERIRMLDEAIDRQQAARAARQEQSRQSGAQARTGRQAGTQRARQVVRGMVQQDNPQTGAFGLGAEYRKAMKERRKQRGLPEY